jgi:hypothetical protein
VPVSGEAKRDRHGIPAREFTALNGRSWPYTERLRYTLGDSVRWRIVNVSFQPHPMHLHGFFFRVDSHGIARIGTDSLYTPEQRRMAVTEVVGIGETASIVWSPDRPGGWIFHCQHDRRIHRTPSESRRGATTCLESTTVQRRRAPPRRRDAWLDHGIGVAP